MTEEEFVRGCLEDEELVRALSDRSSDPPMVVQISADSTPRYSVSRPFFFRSIEHNHIKGIIEKNP